MKFHPAKLFSPIQSTFVKAIKNSHLLTWPGLDENLVTKNFPPSLNTTKGHVQQINTTSSVYKTSTANR